MTETDSNEWTGKLYYQMVLIRRFEERLTGLYKEGVLRGSLHLCIGKEATGVGGCAALRADDYMTCTYRGHGQSLAKGLAPRVAMAELSGKETGCCKGRGGSMHFTDVSIGLLGENAIVGAGLPLAVRCSIHCKNDQDRGSCLTYFGEGTTNQGVFHEALNLAAVWELPVVFFVRKQYLCRNDAHCQRGQSQSDVSACPRSAMAFLRCKWMVTTRSRSTRRRIRRQSRMRGQAADRSLSKRIPTACQDT